MSKKKSRFKGRLNLTTDTETRKILDALALSWGLSVSGVVRRLVSTYDGVQR